MGFYVDTAEIKKALEGYQKLSKKAQSQLVTAKTSMNSIINSNAMHGQVGQAIAADINNNQNAVIVGLKSSYSALEVELRQACQEFKSATGESSDAAVLSEEALIKAKSEIDQLKQTYQEQATSIQSVYSSISDLISLSASKSNFNEVSNTAKKYVNEIIKKVNQFDSERGNSANEDMIQSLGTQIKAAEKVGSLSYKDPQFLAFVNSTALADNVQAFHTNVIEAEEKQQQTKEKDLNSMTPSEMIAKYGVDDPDVKKRINSLNNQLTANGFLTDTSLNLTEEYLVKYGDNLAVGLYNAGTKYFGGTGVASAFYVGSKATSSLAGSAGKAIPVIGSVIDYTSQIYMGETAHDALGKTGAHVIAGVGIGIGVAALGLTGGWAIAAGVGAAFIINEFIVDPLYDQGKKVVGNAVNSVGKWFGNLFE